MTRPYTLWVRESLIPGAPFPDLRLPDHTGTRVRLSELPRKGPIILCFLRGWWCPKEQVRARGLVEMQEEIQREYGKIVVVTTDEPYVNGAFRAGLGADFPFLSDAKREVASELDLLELTDAKQQPFLPYTFLLDSTLRIHRVWLGFWYWGNPAPDELRLALRELTQAEQPTFDPQSVWRHGGAPAEAGIRGPVIWIREDQDGREIWRHLHTETPQVGTEVARSEVDGRPWIVQSVEPYEHGVAVRLRKLGKVPRSKLVAHGITTPHWIR
jgi:peroxiredoxin